MNDTKSEQMDSELTLHEIKYLRRLVKRSMLDEMKLERIIDNESDLIALESLYLKLFNLEQSHAQ